MTGTRIIERLRGNSRKSVHVREERENGSKSKSKSESKREEIRERETYGLRDGNEFKPERFLVMQKILDCCKF